ncbi:MAG: hypothetical protein IJL75_00750 [Eubacterium sp.]|nr:hypothetical protein [Eubacterium sp.]
MSENDYVEYDLDEIIEHLAASGVCTEEEASVYLEAEDAYYDSIGMYDFEDEEAVSDDPASIPVVDQRDVDAYIVQNTDLDESKVEQISQHLVEYMESDSF